MKIKYKKLKSLIKEEIKFLIEEVEDFNDELLQKRIASYFKLNFPTNLPYKHYITMANVYIERVKRVLDQSTVKYNNNSFVAILLYIFERLSSDFKNHYRAIIQKDSSLVSNFVEAYFNLPFLPHDFERLGIKSLKVKEKNIDKLVDKLGEIEYGVKRKKTNLDKFNIKSNKPNKVIEDLSGYVNRGDKEWHYIHMTDIEADARMLYNPSSKYNTPIGVYTYPLSQNMYEDLINNRLPFRNDAKYIVLIKPKSGYQSGVLHIDGKNDISDEKYNDFKKELQTYKANPKETSNRKFFIKEIVEYYKDYLMQKSETNDLPTFDDQIAAIIKSKSDEEFLKLFSKFTESLYKAHIKTGYQDLNLFFSIVSDLLFTYEYKYGFSTSTDLDFEMVEYESLKHFGNSVENENLVKLWGLSRHVAKNDGKRWGMIMRNLNIVGVHDHGMSIIHPNEPEQAVFFTPSHLETVNVYNNPWQKQEKNYGTLADIDWF